MWRHPRGVRSWPVGCDTARTPLRACDQMSEHAALRQCGSGRCAWCHRPTGCVLDGDDPPENNQALVESIQPLVENIQPLVAGPCVWGPGVGGAVTAILCTPMAGSAAETLQKCGGHRWKTAAAALTQHIAVRWHAAWCCVTCSGRPGRGRGSLTDPLEVARACCSFNC